jgi:phospholipid-binding lipoprotein MlaA
LVLLVLGFFVFATANIPAIAETETPSATLIAQSDAPNDNGDPLESLNRVTLEVNEFIMDLLLRPIAGMYTLILPEFLRDGISNALKNLNTPVVLINDILQFEPERAWTTTQRFFINTTIGVGGLMDVAKDFGLKGHKEDLGQTFAVWGVPEGFYLVLPIFGPSNPRDAVGLALNSFLNPISYWADNTDREEIPLAMTMVSGVDEFSRVMDDLEKLKKTSIDYYAALRSIARQKREAEILNGAPKAGAPLPDLKYDFNAEFTQ